MAITKNLIFDLGNLIRKLYRDSNEEKIKKYRIKWKLDNKYYHLNYQKNRINNDHMFKLSRNVRSRINGYLKKHNIIKQNRTFDIVGCSPEFLREHIEKQFTEGMSWGLLGQHIHIDHIIPLSSANTEEEIYKLCHYSNLQPLWAEDNLKKSNKY